MLIKINNDLAVSPQDVKSIKLVQKDAPIPSHIEIKMYNGVEWRINNSSQRRFNKLVKDMNEALRYGV